MARVVRVDDRPPEVTAAPLSDGELLSKVGTASYSSGVDGSIATVLTGLASRLDLEYMVYTLLVLVVVWRIRGVFRRSAPAPSAEGEADFVDSS